MRKLNSFSCLSPCSNYEQNESKAFRSMERTAQHLLTLEQQSSLSSIHYFFYCLPFWILKITSWEEVQIFYLNFLCVLHYKYCSSLLWGTLLISCQLDWEAKEEEAALVWFLISDQLKHSGKQIIVASSTRSDSFNASLKIKSVQTQRKQLPCLYLSIYVVAGSWNTKMYF